MHDRLQPAVQAETCLRSDVSDRFLANDEHRLELKPVYRRVWSRTGEQPKAVVAHRSRWCSVATCVTPETGERLRWLANRIDTEVMRRVLRALTATWSEAAKVWVVLDRAGWHVSPTVKIPDG
ncbi:transposase [Chloroflexus sp.]|uniref:transposase n=1 Tax=Chloroflexus sp. TaxID=1904827 RepID=UPI003A100980